MKPASIRQTLPIPPQQALPLPPPSQQEEALRERLADAQDALLAVLENNQSQLAKQREKHARQTKPANAKRKRNAAAQKAQICKAFVTEMKRRAREGLKFTLKDIDETVAKQLGVSTRSVQRATSNLRKKRQNTT
jgi:hypothetical protein